MYTEEEIRRVLTREADVQAALDPLWNRRGLRPAENPVIPTKIVLPEMVRDFMAFVGIITAGTVVIQGGALDDIAHGRVPQDYDGLVLTKHAPLDAMQIMQQADQVWQDMAERQNPTPGLRPELKPKAPKLRILGIDPRIELSWKKLEIKTRHGKFDLNFIQKQEKLSDFVKQAADLSDVGVCARSEIATHGGQAYVSQRWIDDEARGTLTFRALRNDNERFVHLTRWYKYAVAKYPKRPVIYTSADDAALFKELNARRAEFIERFAELSAPGRRLPKHFKSFRSIMPDFYDTLSAKARATFG